MVLNGTNLFLAFLVSLLISLGFWSVAQQDHKEIIALGSFVLSFTTLSSAGGIDYGYPRTNVNIRVLSGVFFLVGLITNSVFVIFWPSGQIYLACCGLPEIIFVVLLRSILATQQ